MADLIVPTVIEQTQTGERTFDLYSRLLRDRIVFLGTPLDDTVANLLTAQLLLLEHEDPDADINLYVNSPGGSMTALFGVYDVLRYVRPDVATTCMGMAASAAAVLLAAGAPGKRHALPNARILIHQPHGQIPESQAADIGIHAAEALRQREAMNEILARHTGRPVDEIARDTDRDRIMSADEAREYGLVDDVVSPRDLKMEGYVPEDADDRGNGRRR